MHVREMAADELHGWLRDGRSFHLVDVREESEWNRGHLPGAVHLCKGILERDIEVRIPDVGATVVLYCGGGYRSVLAADAMRQMGYRDVISLAGGWREWTARGLPTESA